MKILKRFSEKIAIRGMETMLRKQTYCCLMSLNKKSGDNIFSFYEDLD